jgi:hypothetical protein
MHLVVLEKQIIEHEYPFDNEVHLLGDYILDLMIQLVEV